MVSVSSNGNGLSVIVSPNSLEMLADGLRCILCIGLPFSAIRPQAGIRSRRMVLALIAEGRERSNSSNVYHLIPSASRQECNLEKSFCLLFKARQSRKHTFLACKARQQTPNVFGFMHNTTQQLPRGSL